MEDKTKLKNEIIRFIDLHELPESTKTASLYASFHVLYYIADNYNIRTTDTMRLRLQATVTQTLRKVKTFLLSHFAYLRNVIRNRQGVNYGKNEST